jgi:hypothetical protein
LVLQALDCVIGLVERQTKKQALESSASRQHFLHQGSLTVSVVSAIFE